MQPCKEPPGQYPLPPDELLGDAAGAVAPGAFLFFLPPPPPPLPFG